MFLLVGAIGSGAGVAAMPPNYLAQETDTPLPEVTSPLDLPPSRFEVVDAGELDVDVLDSLEKRLRLGNLPATAEGMVVFQFPVSEGKIGRILFDDRQSTLIVPSAISPIKQIVSSWIPPGTFAGLVRLKLKVLPLTSSR